MNKGKRILLVDDEPDNNRIFTIALRDKGFEVDSFEDPKLALSAFKPDYYDLIVIDISMPNMQGDELYHKLRKIVWSMYGEVGILGYFRSSTTF